MGITSRLRSEIQTSALTIERTSLKEQTVNILRDLIVSGQIAPGSKITERDIAELLSISRMPARDALMELERQGLVINKPGGRFVIQLSETEIHQLYTLRLTLEKLALDLAIQNSSPEKTVLIQAKLAEMHQSIVDGNTALYSISDLELHEIIWEQAGNPYLEDMLHSMIGPIFMLIASQARVAEDWQESLRLHEQLVETMASRDIPAAQKSIEAHLLHSLEMALSAFQ